MFNNNKKEKDIIITVMTDFNLFKLKNKIKENVRIIVGIINRPSSLVFQNKKRKRPSFKELKK